MTRTESTLETILLAGVGALAAAEKDGAKQLNRLVKRGQQTVSRALPTVPAQASLFEALQGERIFQVQFKAGQIKVLGWDGHALGPEEGSAFEASEKITPPTLSAAAETTHLRRNAEARVAFFQEFGTLTSQEVAAYAGSSAANKAALANRWKTEGRIFAIETGGKTRFPAFQFSADDGQPLSAIAEILKILQPRLSGWQTALWFTGRNGWLGAKRPVDILTSDPAAAVEAARQEAEALALGHFEIVPL